MFGNIEGKTEKESIGKREGKRKRAIMSNKEWKKKTRREMNERER